MGIASWAWGFDEPAAHPLRDAHVRNPPKDRVPCPSKRGMPEGPGVKQVKSRGGRWARLIYLCDVGDSTAQTTGV